MYRVSVLAAFVTHVSTQNASTQNATQRIITVQQDPGTLSKPSMYGPALELRRFRWVHLFQAEPARASTSSLEQYRAPTTSTNGIESAVAE